MLNLFLTILLTSGIFVSPFLFVKEQIRDEVVLLFGSQSAIESDISFDVPEQQQYIQPVRLYEFPIRNWSIEEPFINAKAAVSFDAASGKFLYEKELDRELPVASLTKLMTSAIVLETFHLDELITISPSAIEKSRQLEGGKELYGGEVLRVEDLLKVMLIKSNNEAAFAFQEAAAEKGIDLLFVMNEKAIDIGMTNTFFNDPAGLDDVEGFSTADDIIRLVQYSLKYDILHSILRTPQETVFSQDRSIVHRIFSTNKLLGLLPNLITGKTGYTDTALGSIAVVTKSPSGGNIITIILGSPERFTQTKKLVDWVNAAFLWGNSYD